MKARKALAPFKSKLERDYAGYLQTQLLAGEIPQWSYEPFNLNIGTKCWYKIDFMIINNDGEIELHEVKGSWKAKNQRDAYTRIRVAAKAFPFFKFVAVTRERDRWIKKEIS